MDNPEEVEQFKAQLNFELDRYLTTLGRASRWTMAPIWFFMMVVLLVVDCELCNRPWIGSALLISWLVFVWYSIRQRDYWADQALVHNSRYKKLVIQTFGYD